MASRPARTVGRSRLKFAHFVENELRTMHIEKRGRWSRRLARDTSWKSADFPVALTWEKFRPKSSKTSKWDRHGSHPGSIARQRRRAGRRRRRGTRAGHRVQRRRSRAGCDLDRAVRGGSAGPRDRCLVSPARLTLRQTAQWEPSRPEREERHTLSIGHSNVRSIVPKMDEINRLLQHHDLDVFCATETWLTDPAQDRILIFPGYRIERRDRPSPPSGGRRSAGRGGGVAVIYREELTAAVLPIPSAGPCETLWLGISGGGRRSATVGVVYRPPSSPVAGAVDDLHDQLLAARGYGKPVFCLGDTNINLLRPDGPGVRQYRAALHELDLTHLVTEPTHLEPTGSLIDHIITDVPDLTATVVAPPDFIADHLTVIVRAPIRRPSRRPAPFTARPWRKVDWDAVCLDFLRADWSAVYDSVAVDDKVSAFLSVWWSVFDVHCPSKRVTPRRHRCPWLDDYPELRELMGERDSAYRVWRRSRSDADREEYRRLRNCVKRRLIRCKREFLSADMLSDRRAFWRNLKDFALRPARGGGGAGEGMPPGQEDAFNAHFAAVGPRIAAELAASDPSPLPPRPPCVTSAGLRLKPATLPELSLALRRLSSSRAVGHDGVPLHAIRLCFPTIGPRILHIVNSSIVSCTFPDTWKLATVVPLHKSGAKDEPSNFRPISILPVLSKVCEKIVCTQLSAYLAHCHLLSSSQYAYRTGHSTEDALVDAVEWMTRRVDDGEVVAVSSVDLSRAFDSVDHDVLLTKLCWYGIDPDWFRSYLAGRRQVVRGGSLSLPLSHGVPQGSLVGPILFSIFTNDLPSYLPHGRLVSYADDTQLLDSARPKNLTVLKARYEETLRAVLSFFTSNSFKMNPSKTTLLLVGTTSNLKKTSSFHLNLPDHVLTPSPFVKMLGVTLDPTLSWEKHTSNVAKKCNSILLCLYKIRHHLSPDILNLLIQCHAFPHILYCLSVWGGAAACHLHRVQKVVNFGARVVSGVRKYDHISPTLAALGWSGVRELVARRDSIGVHRALRDPQAPVAVRSLFVPRAAVSQRSTRSTEAGALELPAFRLSTSRRAFSYRAASTWNRLSLTPFPWAP